jgi:hypothetical protein
MSMTTIADVITRVAIFNCEIAQLREVITALAVAEPSHSARGPMLTLATVLNDTHNGLRLALTRYQQ